MKSFVAVPEGSDFPIQNCPYGVFSTEENGWFVDHIAAQPTCSFKRLSKLSLYSVSPKMSVLRSCTPRMFQARHRIGVAIGESILDLSVVAHLFDGPELRDHQHVFKQETLNAFMALPRSAWLEARALIQALLSGEVATLKEDPNLRAKAIVLQNDATMHLPAIIATIAAILTFVSHEIGTLRTGVVMLANALSIRDSAWQAVRTVLISRETKEIILTSTRQYIMPQMSASCSEARKTLSCPTADEPSYGASRLLDFELEMAFFVGGPQTELGQPIPIEKTEEHIFGLVLMNDWSARDIQAWEYVPLGPFLGKSFGTTISPWVVSLEALRPFMVPNPKQEPPPLKYLSHSDPFTIDVDLEVTIKPEGGIHHSVCKTNFKHLYWTMKQQLAHHTVNGCNVRPGDLMGSGTISGPEEGAYGSMLELSWRGSKTIAVGDRSRKFLEDGDEVNLSGVCRKNGVRIGFGECRGKVLPEQRSLTRRSK